MNKDNLLRIIEIKIQIDRLEREDKDKQEILDSGSYALAEGYLTYNMRMIEELEEELNNITL